VQDFAPGELEEARREHRVLSSLGMRRAEGRVALRLGARVVYAADAPFWQLVACMTGCRGGGCSRPTPHLLARTAAQMLRCGAGVVVLDARGNAVLEGAHDHAGALLRPLCELEAQPGLDAWIVCYRCHGIVPAADAVVCAECNVAARCAACARADARGTDDHGCAVAAGEVAAAVADLEARPSWPLVRMSVPPLADGPQTARAVAVSGLDALRGAPAPTDILHGVSDAGANAIVKQPRLVARALLAALVSRDMRRRS